MRHDIQFAVGACAVLATACGGTGVRQDGGPMSEAGAVAASPFEPVAIQNVIDSLVGALRLPSRPSRCCSRTSRDSGPPSPSAPAG
jgi:hypothetical protein